MQTAEKMGLVSHEMQTSLIQVISYENRNITGFLSNPYFGREMYFENLAQLIFLIENMLDDLKCPQKGMESRNFGISEHDWMPVERTVDAPAKRHVLASFQLRILFRQNVSWQGCVTWRERMMETSFRSLLELILLMDSALSSKR